MMNIRRVFVAIEVFLIVACTVPESLMAQGPAITSQQSHNVLIVKNDGVVSLFEVDVMLFPSRNAKQFINLGQIDTLLPGATSSFSLDLRLDTETPALGPALLELRTIDGLLSRKEIDRSILETPLEYSHALSAYPNPFNAGTRIRLTTPSSFVSQSVDIHITDILGRVVRSLNATRSKAGEFEVYWDGKTNSGSVAASGSYFCRTNVAETALISRLLFLK